MKKQVKDKHFLGKPVFRHKELSYKQFIQKNLNYPKEAHENGIEGTVKIRYSIDYKGQVKTVKIVSGLGYGCDEEAERVIRLLKFDVPKTRNVKVLFHKSIQLHFNKKLLKNKQPKASAQPKLTINYNYKQGTSSNTYSYSYQIKKSE